ncbi:MAG: sodium:proton antiporter, partial [Pseudomonadota bacterium]|nr:sodium:proton antiporter [Pseudomonadota bacterium]
MNLLQISALILVLAAAFGTINALYLRLPTAIGILVVALLASFAVMGIDLLIPAYGLADTVRAAVLEIDFSDT